ncbi:MAG: hypothetical protein JWO70_4534 [Betaproteobacteria bacterium]|nr:hypothetical protein [Betaproteobacteria bacterium]
MFTPALTMGKVLAKASAARVTELTITLLDSEQRPMGDNRHLLPKVRDAGYTTATGRWILTIVSPQSLSSTISSPSANSDPIRGSPPDGLRMRALEGRS